MKMIKNILKTLVIFGMFLATVDVYAYNLKFKAEQVTVGSNYTCTITIPTQPHPDRVARYNADAKDAQGWVTTLETSDTRTTGGNGWFDSYEYVFTPTKIYTNYANSGAPNTYIYYDTYSGFIDKNFTNIQSFGSTKITIGTNQGTSTTSTTSDPIFRIAKSQTSGIKLIKWKVMPNGTALFKYEFSSTVINNLINKFGQDALIAGIRFSMPIRSIINGSTINMDTTWKAFKYIDNGWDIGNRGFATINPDSPKKGASLANYFDNILVVDFIKNKDREIYVNHIDAEKNVIPGFANTSLNMIEPKNQTRNNVEPRMTFQEHYKISNSEIIEVRKSGKNIANGVTYIYQGAKMGVGATIPAATTHMQTFAGYLVRATDVNALTNNIGTVSVKTDATNSDVAVLNMVYKKQTTTPVVREIYINHVDEAGNVLAGFQNTSLNMRVIAGDVRYNVEDRKNFQEHYTISDLEQIEIVKSSITTVNGVTYTFKNGKSAEGDYLPSVAAACVNSTNTWAYNPKVFGISDELKNDVLVINLVYTKEPSVVTGQLPTLEIIGRLAFINIDPQYSGSTASTELDYIPSTKTLTPYADGAYPYVVRALRYESKNESFTSSTTSTAYIKYTYQTWTYSHGSALQVGTPAVAPSAGPPPSAGSPAIMIHMHDSTCDWYSSNTTVTINKVFSYTVPYKHTWYQLVNFKMYRISLFEVYDTDSDIGGILFDGGTYTIYPSGTYESRFNNSRGRIPKTLTVIFPTKTYTLPDVSVDLAKPTGGTSTATGATYDSSVAALALGNKKLGEETFVTASDAYPAQNSPELRISYDYDNDYVELDGTDNMLQRQHKAWSERISLTTDTSNVRNLDSTKQGTGQVNGADISYTSNLMNFMRPPIGKRTSNLDFTPNYQTVPSNRENGVRELKGKIFYKLLTDSKYNVGSTDFESTDATYQLNQKLNLTNTSFADADKEYIGSDVNKVNVLTPINFGNFDLITEHKVDHSDSTLGSITILQKNADFTITPLIVSTTTAGYNSIPTREFVKGYYFIFDFNVIYDGNIVYAYTPIYIAGANSVLTAKTTDSYDAGSASQIKNSVKIVAITTNITEALQTRFDTEVGSSYDYIDYLNNKVRNTGIQNQSGLLSRSDIVNDSYHAIYKIIKTANIGRIFDFAITDCTDLAFKDAFRLPNTASINKTSGISYYSGYKTWNLYSNEYNEMIERDNIGSKPQTILPLGPYKNTNSRYVNAPKMGYRISFDLKTTGYMDGNNSDSSRNVEVVPTYYYISKDGKTFDNNIKLYYKTSNNKYVNFDASGYAIYFKPNDGYRNLRSSMGTDIFTYMSTKLEKLLVSKKLVLTNKMMSTNNTSFIQTWYGEFKLPNSTIAVSDTDGNVHKNVNNSYSDGYIGVKFDIKCIDTGGFTLKYNTEDQSAASRVNTSQWDYEGFMNFRTPGSPATGIKYQLEKDIWEIDNALYNQIKGTVVLFDLDNRAANDFE